MKKSENKHLKEKKPERKIISDGFFTGILVLLLSIAAVATGIALPGLASGIQSKKLDSYSRRQELDSGMLSLTSDERKLDKLRCAEFIREENTVELSKGSFSSEEDAKAALNDFLNLLDKAEISFGKERHWEIYNTRVFLLMPEKDNSDSAIIWHVDARDGEGNELSYYMEDSTRLIIRASVEKLKYSHDSIYENWDSIRAALSDYYNFSDIELCIYPEEEKSISLFHIYFMKNQQQLMSIPVEAGNIFVLN